MSTGNVTRPASAATATLQIGRSGPRTPMVRPRILKSASVCHRTGAPTRRTRERNGLAPLPLVARRMIGGSEISNYSYAAAAGGGNPKVHKGGLDLSGSRWRRDPWDPEPDPIPKGPIPEHWLTGKDVTEIINDDEGPKISTNNK